MDELKKWALAALVRAGETRHYPDAEGPVYRAKVDTAYDPDTVPDNWELES